MAQIKIQISGAGPIGEATKDGLKYSIREMSSAWKLVAAVDKVKLEYEFRKKDFPSQNDLVRQLYIMGYETIFFDNVAK